MKSKPSIIPQLYDNACSLIFGALTTAYNPQTKTVSLNHINWRNKEHRVIVHLAVSVANIADARLEINNGLSGWILSWYLRHRVFRNILITRIKDRSNPYIKDAAQILNRVGSDVDYSPIYDEYYKGGER